MYTYIIGLNFFYIELSEVLWTMVLGMGISLGTTMGPAIGSVIVFVLFAFWAGKEMFIDFFFIVSILYC